MTLAQENQILEGEDDFPVRIYSIKSIQQNSHLIDSLSSVLKTLRVFYLALIFLIFREKYIQFQNNQSIQLSFCR